MAELQRGGYVDLSDLSTCTTKAICLQNSHDILQMCDNHQLNEVSVWDQALSAMARVVEWTLAQIFSKVIEDYLAHTQDKTLPINTYRLKNKNGKYMYIINTGTTS